jgi:hypothetical protein
MGRSSRVMEAGRRWTVGVPCLIAEEEALKRDRRNKGIRVGGTILGKTDSKRRPACSTVYGGGVRQLRNSGRDTQ